MSKALVELIKSTEMSKAILDHQISLVLDATSDEVVVAAANLLRKHIYAKLDDVGSVLLAMSSKRSCDRNLKTLSP